MLREKTLFLLFEARKGAVGREYVFIDRLPWWEYTLSKWYLEMQDASGGQFAPSEIPRLKEYRQLLQGNFVQLGYRQVTSLFEPMNGTYPTQTSGYSRKNILVGVHNRISRHSDEVELYDLKNDPKELANVALKYPEVVERLKKPLFGWDAFGRNEKARYRAEDKRLIIPYP